MSGKNKTDYLGREIATKDIKEINEAFSQYLRAAEKFIRKNSQNG